MVGFIAMISTYHRHANGSVELNLFRAHALTEKAMATRFQSGSLVDAVIWAAVHSITPAFFAIQRFELAENVGMLEKLSNP